MKAILKVWNVLEEGVLVITLLFMVILTFLNVIMRKLAPSISFSFTEELTVILFVWISMIGAAICYKKGTHLGLTLITDRLSFNVQKWIVLFGCICSAVMLVFIIYVGWGTVINQIKFGQKTPALGLSEAVGGLAIPIGGVIILIRAVEAGFRNFRLLNAKAKEGKI